MKLSGMDSERETKGKNLEETYVQKKLIDYFLAQFQVHSKIERQIEISHVSLLPHTCIASDIVNMPDQCGTFVTVDEAELYIIINQPESIVNILFALGVILSMGLKKFIMTYIYYYSTILSNFTALEVLCDLPIHPSLTPCPGNH